MKYELRFAATALSLTLLTACAQDVTPATEAFDTDAAPLARFESSTATAPDSSTAEGDGHGAAQCSNGEVAPGLLSAEVAPREDTDPRIVVTVRNQGESAHRVQVGLRVWLGETAPSLSREAVLLGAGETTTVLFDARELGIDVGRLWLPAAFEAKVEAFESTGELVERAFAGGSLGAPLREGVLERAARRVDAKALDVDGRAGAARFMAVVPGGSGRDLIPSGDPEFVDGARPDDAPGTGGLPEPPLDVQTGVYNHTFCFRMPVSLVDAGFGEDFGVHPTNPWVARGMFVRVYAPGGEEKFNGYLDGRGCTTAFTSDDSSGFVIFGYTRARIGNNDVEVYNEDGLFGALAIWGANPGQISGEKVFTFPNHDLSSLLAVSSYVLTRFNGGLSGEVFKVNDRCRPSDGQCCNCAADDGIWLQDTDRKFLLGHELGHRILARYAGTFNNDCSMDLFVNPASPMPCDAGPGASAHSMWSAEFESCAAMEGWAHFVATVAFNNTNTQGASMRYWSGSDPTINVENGPAGGQTAYFDNVCNLASPSVVSVELDWLRQWWDYRTNDGANDAGDRPSNAQMMDEIGASMPWTNQTTYSNLIQGIEDTSGADQSTRWSEMGTWNGID